MKYLIAGLGNVGLEYEHTRHNIGFQVVEKMAHDHEVSFQSDRLADVVQLSYKGRKLTLLKPTTYMNQSGRAVRYWLQALQIPPSQVLIITDDLHLPLGTLRLRTEGSHAGHNGLRNITEELQTSQYARLRFGIDRNFSTGQQSTYVLNPFKSEEQTKLPLLIEKAAEMAFTFCWRGAKDTMQRYND
jgi:PTH1 family peptidyl-tRNA hydrolase